MSVFVCAKCGCVDNTATSDYWALRYHSEEYIWDKSLIPYKGKPLCSECARVYYSDDKDEAYVVPGKWHGKFPKEMATEEEKRNTDKRGIIWF